MQGKVLGNPTGVLPEGDASAYWDRRNMVFGRAAHSLHFLAW